MYIEAVIVSINYADFLKHTLPYNKSIFDKIIVVTDTKDFETKKVCDFYNVQCIQTDKVYENGSNIPNKGVAINEGLSKLSLKGWVVQLDADIWMPPISKEILNRLKLDSKCIYGIDRFMCNSYEDWQNYLISVNKPTHSGWIYLHTDLFPIGTRVVQYKGDGYWPIGFFQLWNPNGSGIKTYPKNMNGYDRTDVVHLKEWKPEFRRFIPDIICIHLASQSHSQGQNWKGRNTAKFAPKEKITLKEKIVIFLKNLFYNFLNFFKKRKY